jgi:hypothetical protein
MSGVLHGPRVLSVYVLALCCWVGASDPMCACPAQRWACVHSVLLDVRTRSIMYCCVGL